VHEGLLQVVHAESRLTTFDPAFLFTRGGRTGEGEAHQASRRAGNEGELRAAIGDPRLVWSSALSTVLYVLVIADMVIKPFS
jgi:hypothetical protein